MFRLPKRRRAEEARPSWREDLDRAAEPAEPPASFAPALAPLTPTELPGGGLRGGERGGGEGKDERGGGEERGEEEEGGGRGEGGERAGRGGRGRGEMRGEGEGRGKRAQGDESEEKGEGGERAGASSHAEDDDDDDDDFDPSVYDVGPDDPAEPHSTSPPPEAGGWPPACGQLVEARYTPASAWKEARVVQVCEASVVVVFAGYGDEVRLPVDRVQPRAHERAAALARDEVRLGRTGAWGAPRLAAAAVDMESQEERRIREMCVAVYQQRADAGEEASAREGSTHSGTSQLDGSNKGRQLLEKLGWSPGNGIGKQQAAEPKLVCDVLPMQTGKHGLGHHDTGPGGWRKL
ncbi:hypothetical protein AB1Y20_003381 [Prymnesium parvum]|uniref:G-patch domain-containing protein n=1 Tax=Prymnesium parvum TaxID=97485 RepID=A0AB34JC16_PRYPA